MDRPTEVWGTYDSDWTNWQGVEGPQFSSASLISVNQEKQWLPFKEILKLKEGQFKTHLVQGSPYKM